MRRSPVLKKTIFLAEPAAFFRGQRGPGRLEIDAFVQLTVQPSPAATGEMSVVISWP